MPPKFWIESRCFFSLFLIILIGVVKSEFVTDPGIIRPSALGKLLFNRVLIILFQIEHDLNTKLCFDISRLILGKVRINLSAK